METPETKQFDETPLTTMPVTSLLRVPSTMEVFDEQENKLYSLTDFIRAKAVVTPALTGECYMYSKRVDQLDVSRIKNLFYAVAASSFTAGMVASMVLQRIF